MVLWWPQAGTIGQMDRDSARPRRLRVSALAAVANPSYTRLDTWNLLDDACRHLAEVDLAGLDKTHDVCRVRRLMDRLGAYERYWLYPGAANLATFRAHLDSLSTVRLAEEVSLASLESIARTDHAPGKEVLHDVDFTAEPGQLVALVGPSGAGKSTITHLVSRLYDVSDGAVRIGGADVRDLTLDSLRAEVGVVSQDAHLFHDTIRENMRYARPEATDEEILAALDAAQIGRLVAGMPEGLDTVVGDRGYRLSGGEKQRLAIARLLLKAPSVVVLDEATAHLDSESEAAVQEALRTALAGRTSLVIAHRLSTIREADQILVIEEGRVAERGRHEELLLEGGLYAELYRTQFSHQKDEEWATEPLGAE